MPEHDQTVEGLKLINATLEDRVMHLEAMVSKLADHQVNLGRSVIRAHEHIIEIKADLHAEGIANAQDANGSALIGIKPPKIITN